VRAQIAELLALQTTLQNLIDRAQRSAPGTAANVCWILETNSTEH